MRRLHPGPDKQLQRFSFDDSGDLCSVLAMLSPLSERQLKLILRAAIANEQIHRARTAIRPLSKIVKDNKKRVDKMLWAEFSKVSR